MACCDGRRPFSAPHHRLSRPTASVNELGLQRVLIPRPETYFRKFQKIRKKFRVEASVLLPFWNWAQDMGCMTPGGCQTLKGVREGGGPSGNAQKSRVQSHMGRSRVVSFFPNLCCYRGFFSFVTRLVSLVPAAEHALASWCGGRACIPYLRWPRERKELSAWLKSPVKTTVLAVCNQAC